MDEPVALAEHQPGWATAFLAERARLVAALGIPEQLVVHIGSTAVADLPAKPVLDLMLGLPAPPPAPRITAAIERLGYEPLGEAGVPGRWYFRCRGAVPANLHVVRHEGGHWAGNLAFRDHLRTDASARRRYAEAKRRAIASGATTLLAYSAAKAVIIEALLREAAAGAG